MKYRFLPYRRCHLRFVRISFVFVFLLLAFACVVQGKTKQEHVETGEDASPSCPVPGVVRFAMYNVRNYFVEEDAKRSDYPRPIKSIEERDSVARTLARVRPHVVGLVEIGGQAALDDLAARLEKYGLRYDYRFVLERAGEDRALALLSSLPIEHNQSQANYRLTGERGKRCMLRGILDVTVRDADNCRWRIIGVHLKSRKDGNKKAGDSLRDREVRTLASYVQLALQQEPSASILVYGDWNTGSDDPVLLPLTRPHDKKFVLSRLEATDSKGNGWTIFYNPLKEYSAYDQIYATPILFAQLKNSPMGIIETSRQEKFGSDHRAVWCDLPCKKHVPASLRKTSSRHEAR